MAKPILCLDFDGVIHSYSSGWKGATTIPDPPVEGALKFIVEAMKHFEVAIYSTRSNAPGGIEAMMMWLDKWSVDEHHGMPGDFDHGIWGALQWPTEKPPAFLTIDDRAMMFKGVWPPPEILKSFEPWNKKRTGPTGDFPDGKLGPDDDGGLKMAIGIDEAGRLVRIEFGAPTAWLAMPPDLARVLAMSLLEKADAVERMRKQ